MRADGLVQAAIRKRARVRVITYCNLLLGHELLVGGELSQLRLRFGHVLGRSGDGSQHHGDCKDGFHCRVMSSYVTKR
jgi:hypothetical protein